MVEVTMKGLEERRKLLEESDVDFERTMVKLMAKALTDAKVDALYGAPHGERHPERTNRRKGYRELAWDTRTGTIEPAVPKLRAGTYLRD
jgi:transposase-like protein